MLQDLTRSYQCSLGGAIVCSQVCRPPPHSLHLAPSNWAECSDSRRVDLLSSTPSSTSEWGRPWICFWTFSTEDSNCYPFQLFFPSLWLDFTLISTSQLLLHPLSLSLVILEWHQCALARVFSLPQRQSRWWTALAAHSKCNHDHTFQVCHLEPISHLPI